jgi:hypothetical protein
VPCPDRVTGAARWLSVVRYCKHVTTQVTIAVPDDLMDRLEVQAEMELRTVEGQVLWLLKNAVNGPRSRRPQREERLRRTGALFKELDFLYIQAGKPSLRHISMVTRRQGAHEVGHSTVHTLLDGTVPPSWPVLEAVVLALGGDAGYFKDLWVEANA